MKTISIITFLGLVFSLNLNGQTDKNSDLFGNRKNDSLRIPIPRQHSEYGNSDKKFESQGDILINPDLEMGHKHFNIESPTIIQFNEKFLAEKFPGSDRYYAKRPYLINPNEKSFIKRPDTGTKYFLIIKNPVTGRITK